MDYQLTNVAMVKCPMRTPPYTSPMTEAFLAKEKKKKKCTLVITHD